jgi:hypothetical protein
MRRYVLSFRFPSHAHNFIADKMCQDHDRVKHLEQMDPVFENLIQSSDYPKMLTSWN